MNIAHEKGCVSQQKARQVFYKMLNEPSHQSLWDFLQVAPDECTQEFMLGYAEALGHSLPDLKTKQEFAQALSDADCFVNWFKVIRSYQPKSLLEGVEFKGRKWSFPEIFDEFDSDTHARRNFLEILADPAKLATIFPKQGI